MPDCLICHPVGRVLAFCSVNRKAQSNDPTGDGIRVVREQGDGPRTAIVAVAIVVVAAIAAFVALRVGGSRGDAPPSRLSTSARRTSMHGARPDSPPNRDAAQPRKPTKETPPRRAIAIRRSKPKVPDEAEHGEPRKRDAAGEAPGDKQPEVAAGDYIAALRDTGERAGIAAFPPPGTRPSRSGVVVPPDYDLPEGLARHYQSTDDGRRLDPILVVAPGYEIVDEAGEAVALTDDRIVPPEYAPPDLPVHLLEVPFEHRAGED